MIKHVFRSLEFRYEKGFLYTKSSPAINPSPGCGAIVMLLHMRWNEWATSVLFAESTPRLMSSWRLHTRFSPVYEGPGVVFTGTQS